MNPRSDCAGNSMSNHIMTPTTRKYPRTMTEAFGPYHHLAPLHVEYIPMHRHNRIVTWGCVIILIVGCVVAYVA